MTAEGIRTGQVYEVVAFSGDHDGEPTFKHYPNRAADAIGWANKFSGIAYEVVYGQVLIDCRRIQCRFAPDPIAGPRCLRNRHTEDARHVWLRDGGFQTTPSESEHESIAIAEAVRDMDGRGDRL